MTLDIQDRLRKLEEKRKKGFPQTIEEFHTKPDTMKYEIALLLIHNQESVRHKYNWQPTEIKALKNLATKDVWLISLSGFLGLIMTRVRSELN